MTHRDIMQATPAAITLCIAGCVASPEGYLAAHPETPRHLAASMRQGDVVAGMTRDHVRMIWGMPDRQAGWSGGDSWAYMHSSNGRAKSHSWGNSVSDIAGSSQQDQVSFTTREMAASIPRRMVYFRGDQVVLVEKAPGEL